MGILATEMRVHIIKPTLLKLGLQSRAAENLLLGTAAQESQLGSYLKQKHGPALGVYQIEPATHKDVWVNFLDYRIELKRVIRNLVVEVNDNDLIGNLVYSTAIARMIYFRIPKALPEADNIEGLANYWKKYYNTLLGKGRVSDFIKNYERYCYGSY